MRSLQAGSVEPRTGRRVLYFFFSSRRRHTRFDCDWSSDVCSSDLNRYLLDHMAKLGRGAVAYLGLNDDGAVVMDDFIERISHAALTDLRVDWEIGRASCRERG